MSLLMTEKHPHISKPKRYFKRSKYFLIILRSKGFSTKKKYISIRKTKMLLKCRILENVIDVRLILIHVK